jgi:hypothetical protein
MPRRTPITYPMLHDIRRDLAARAAKTTHRRSHRHGHLLCARLDVESIPQGELCAQ